ncbi:cysteine-rich receptor-like protein kinase 15 isoform X2 [Punica granatum]|uniref:Cysteine-rich receptor-like protein kinase 15 isoform X2 n=1 Tax=Punica granatum TaxID=22663 RepID=A0A6P8DLP9_PUNGR|nr:cysteine-rich receptor-like protein kinase 15 isoform X2 [Punica granatum]
MSVSLTASVFLLMCLLLNISCKSEAQPSPSRNISACYTPSNSSPYQENVKTVLSSLTSKHTSDYLAGFATAVARQGTPDQVFGLFLCRADLSSASCQACVTNASEGILLGCAGYKDSTIWYDLCMLTYNYQPIVSTLRVSTHACWYEYNISDATTTSFKKLLKVTLEALIPNAAGAQLAGKKFAVNRTSLAELWPLYTLAQCTPDLTAPNCSQCLQAAAEKLPLGKGGAMSLLQSCNIRYSNYLFYNETTVAELLSPPPAPAPRSAEAIPNSPALVPRYRANLSFDSDLPVPPVPPEPMIPLDPAPISPLLRSPPPAPAPRSPLLLSPPPAPAPRSAEDIPRPGVIVAIIIAAISVTVVLFLILCCFLRRRHGFKQYKNVAKDIKTAEAMQFDFAAIQAATSNFSADNELGKGGFGVVYKGRLQDGQDVAVKRLFRSSFNCCAEFKNEVEVVAKLQHRNLVRLLGFCVEGEEKILIFEYMPNRSLDYFLFDSEKRGLLDWSRRYSIISEIAQGMLYLHEYSRLRIIHRDLKIGNILLDANMHPKISDFGMARIVGVDQTQGTASKIAGTLDYIRQEEQFLCSSRQC